MTNTSLAFWGCLIISQIMFASSNKLSNFFGWVWLIFSSLELILLFLEEKNKIKKSNGGEVNLNTL